jgi:hypothetical protein
MAWDDDQLDAGDGQPAGNWKRTGPDTQRAAALVEDAEFVREHGGYRLESVAAVAARLGVNRNTLDKAYERAARIPDLQAG